MINKNLNLEYEYLCQLIDVLSECMNDYLYICDVQNDRYYISNKALERFAIPSNEFNNVFVTHKQFVYGEDYDDLKQEFDRIAAGVVTHHDMHYRWLEKDNLEPIWINCRGEVIFDDDGEPLYLFGCINEIGQRQTADNISGLLGGVMLYRAYQDAISSDRKGIVIRLGIDGFKEINENHGNDYGDMIIRKTAECIKRALVPGQSVYRVTADEYAVIDLSAKTISDSIDMYDRVCVEINQFIIENGYDVFYTISAGIIDVANLADNSFDNILKVSEFALNEAKLRGKNQFYIYDAGDYAKFRRRRHLINEVRRSVNEGFDGFEAYFQPIVEMRGQSFVGAETLLRYKTSDGESVSPVEFIPILEDTGLIIPVGRFVLREASRICNTMQLQIPGFYISVNVSYIQVLRSDYLRELINMKEEMKIPDGSLVVELTESGFLESNSYFVDFCKKIQDAGIKIALDDFGTGYSNFHYLYNLRPDTMKIDRSFTMKAIDNKYEMALLKHISDMIHDVDLKLVIEGIETKEELEKIKEVEPDYIQGFYFGKPMPRESFMELVRVGQAI